MSSDPYPSCIKTKYQSVRLPSFAVLKAAVRFRVKHMIEQIIDILESKQYSDIKPLLEGRHPGDISDIIEELPNHYGGIVFRLLPKDLAIEVFENFDSSFRETLLASLKSEEVIKILNEMSPDDRTRLLKSCPHRLFAST